MQLFKNRKTHILNPKMTVMRFLTFLIGISLYAIAFNVFFLPFKIVIGGISGLSIITNHFLDINPALFIFEMSLILLLISFIILKRNQTMSYIFGSLALPLAIEIASPLATMHFLRGADALLVVIFGGLIAGVGTGLIFKTGFLTGETDIISQIIAKYTKLTPNRSAFLFGTIVVVLGGFISTAGTYDFTRVMHAIVALYISITISEKVIIGISSNKTFYIFTSKTDEVKEYIMSTFNTTLTVMKATGGYSGTHQNVLMCVIPTRDYFKIREGLRFIDSESFFVANDAYETTTRPLFKEE